jgi:hypothetical protein
MKKYKILSFTCPDTCVPAPREQPLIAGHSTDVTK